MKKKVLIVCMILLLLSVIGAYVFITKGAKGKITYGTASDRAREFISEQQKEGDQEWTTTDLDGKNRSSGSAKGSTFSVSCFSLTVPFETVSQKEVSEGNHCTWNSRVLSPPSQLTVGLYEQGSFDEDTSITIRRKQVDVYAEENISLQNFTHSALFYSPDTVTLFAWKEGKMITVSFVALTNPKKITQEDLKLLADSITMNTR